MATASNGIAERSDDKSINWRVVDIGFDVAYQQNHWGGWNCLRLRGLQA